MNGTDKSDGRMRSPQMFAISILINRLNWCVAGANSTYLTGTSAPAGLLLFTRSQLIVDGFYYPCVHSEGSRQTCRHGATPLRTVEQQYWLANASIHHNNIKPSDSNILRFLWQYHTAPGTLNSARPVWIICVPICNSESDREHL